MEVADPRGMQRRFAPGWAPVMLAALVLGAGGGAPALAHGFHNAALATRSLDEWLSDVNRAIPDLKERFDSTELQSGRDLSKLKERVDAAGSKQAAPRLGPRGRIQSDLTPWQQALLARKANDCLEILAYLDRKNIFPQEFPNFQLDRIPEYRKTAGQLLRLMGPEGTRQVAGQLRQALMGQIRFRDCEPHPEYFLELLALLEAGAKAGDLSERDILDLLEATQGKKPPPLDVLAQRVQQALSFDNVDLLTLARIVERMNDPNTRRRLANKMREKIASAGIVELLKV